MSNNTRSLERTRVLKAELASLEQGALSELIERHNALKLGGAGAWQALTLLK
jgi:hypothetical protein